MEKLDLNQTMPTSHGKSPSNATPTHKHPSSLILSDGTVQQGSGGHTTTVKRAEETLKTRQEEEEEEVEEVEDQRVVDSKYTK